MNTNKPAVIKTKFKYLRAISAFASLDKMRYILNGVCLEIRNGQLLIIATDGRRIGIYKDGNADLHDTPDCSIIIPLHLIEMLAKVEPEEDYDEVEDAFTLPPDDITIATDADTVWLKSWRGDAAGHLIQGNFPDWRICIQTKKGNSIFNSFSGALLSEYCEASIILTEEGKKPNISMTQSGKDGAILIRFGREVPFIGVLMPVKADSENSLIAEVPDWVK